ncbi:MAG TPA: DUF3473 domain-containing protein [Nitrospirae bacterium]|nr:DUF3473 domain-containing protein [Nitrospirota bacterium]
MADRYILLSLDVEEFDLPKEYGIEISDDDAINKSTEGLLKVIALIESFNIQCTCFITAYFAENNKKLINTISQRHEIASHGYYHSKNLEGDLIKSKTTIEEIISKKVIGYRQPRLSKIELHRLIEAGYSYDSSINPIWLPKRYNNLSKARVPFKNDHLWVLPISASPIIRYPLFWLSFKNTPESLYQMIAKWTLRQDKYLNIYFHPWEFTDLSEFNLPFYIKKHSGIEMLQRLEDLLNILKNEGTFMTNAHYVNKILN